MAKYEKTVYGDFDSILEKLNDAVMSGSMSASYEGGSDFSSGGSQGMFFKLNTIGEEPFLETIADVVDSL